MTSDTQTPSSQRILFVDDEANILSSLKRLFMEESFEVLTAQSGKEGLELLARNPDVAVIISDQRMPEMNGAEFLEKSRAIVPDAIRIVLTGYADIQTAVDAINKGGAQRYISKPWNDEELVAVVRDAAGRHFLQQENKRLAAIVQRQNEELKQWSAQLELDVQRQTIELAKKNEALNKSNDRLKKNFHESILAFAGLIELRDHSSMSHFRNVEEIATCTAQELGLAIEEVERVTIAALLHDIGKIGMPDILLMKSYETMTPDEKQEFRLHSIRGQAAIDHIEDLRQAGILIRHHHEAFDGKGFPDRLKGNAIPLGARIICVADFFDRTFVMQQGKNAVDIAWDLLKEEEGKKLDPSVCKAIEKHIRLAYANRAPKRDMVEIELSIADLAEGLVLAKDVTSGTGLLLLGKGVTIGAKHIQTLQRHNQLDPFKGGVYVWSKR